MTKLKAKHMRHFVSLEQYDNEEIIDMIESAIEFKRQTKFPTYTENYAINCFFEQSTRTHKSFEMAERKMGMQVLDFQPSMSSVQKGESLYDTVLTLQAIGVDIVVIRHSEEAYYTKLIESDSIKCSIINGGDGAGQHPSQSLLDLMTIYEEYGSFKNLKVAISGDLTHSRVAKSNMQILKRLGATLYFTGPQEWYEPSFEEYGTFTTIDKLIDKVDVMMLLRVQHERHQETDLRFSENTYLQKYGITFERESRMKESAIIMHPAPVNRGVEIEDSLVECERSRIVRQMENGVYARIAIIDSVLKHR
ncbi:aspartate carbamoyltransferase catalytic subunit [Alkalibacterium sp. 20]|uniref:aspartate carbamoyltransferase catalytic subunit n=1 Tax=Alkalibacterium sp. 20 TaxID=1798803 RepID=UPI000900284E|nr:aspartate carbamoyltransferase catalytic subunit [Alkalibacterium sp. 20]OJF92937.1 aspartate carbamoyltransferase catalytic subunit [Alkalibacterium sp. 20]